MPSTFTGWLMFAYFALGAAGGLVFLCTWATGKINQARDARRAARERLIVYPDVERESDAAVIENAPVEDQLVEEKTA
jgi:hypothetical protein